MKQFFQISMVTIALLLMSFSIKAIVVWESDVVNAGEIPQGTPKTFEFTFKNMGDKEVVITNVKTTCGCTASEYTKEPIGAGKSGTVKLVYNAAGKGAFIKTATVTTNAEETPKVLTLKGTVI